MTEPEYQRREVMGIYKATPPTLADGEKYPLTLTSDAKLRVDDPTTQDKVDDVEDKLDSATHGLAALKALIDAVEAKLDVPANFKADLTTLESRISAARAGYLDQLDFNLQESLEDWRWDVLKNNAYLAISGTWAFADHSTYRLGRILWNSPANLNDEIRMPLFVRSSSARTLNIRCITSTTYGIATVYVDGVSQGTIDFYSAASAFNVVKTLSITPARAGLNALTVKMTSKNASSTDYYIAISEMWLT